MRTRIAFCGAVLLTLTLTTAIPQFGQNAKNEPSDADQVRHIMAISLLRAINTMGVVLRMKNGSYATWNELLTSQEFTEDTAKCVTENGMPLAAAHFATGPEILPGWSLRPNLTKDGAGYDLMLEDTTDKTCGYAAVTDERGIIRQSKAIDCPI
jgi:hypothetical protein